MNKVILPQWALERGRSRGGVSSLNPGKTALLVVDLQNAFMVPGQPLANPHACDIVPNVNALAREVRAAGGKVVFLRHTFSDDPRYKMAEWQLRMVPRTPAGDFQLRSGTFEHRLNERLEVLSGDSQVEKHRFSAFLPNSSDLDAQLRAQGIDSLIVTGTLTNVCCESTARDAHMLGYKVVFVSDATAAFTDEEHNATLLNMAAVFAEVRTADSTVELFGSVE